LLIAGLALLSGAPSAAATEDHSGIPVAPGVFAVSASDVVDGDGSPDSAGATGAELRTPRIVGGTTTTIASWPWQAAITLDPADFTGTPFQRQFCGGSLVAPNVIVTAAHCIYDDSTDSWTPPGDYASITGRTTLSNTAEGQEIQWSNYYYFVDGAGNQLYDPNTSRWDVVVATLASASPASNSAPIKIAGANEAAIWVPADENAWATGWGTTSSGGSKSDTLRQVELDVLADSVCGSSYGAGFHSDVMLCAGETAGGQDTCQGDSGGPLVAELASSGTPTQKFRLIGDTSFGFGCALAGFPGVYGRVAQDPICSAVRNLVLDPTIGNTDAIGSGGCLAAPTSGGGGSPPPGPPPGGDGSSGDATPPETTITGGPPDRAKGRSVSFIFTANEPATFQCSVDGSPFQPCSSPQTVTNPKGKHVFEVRAIDAIGNIDPTPARDTWRKKKKKRRR
jgi:hypothetical protein